MRQDLTGDVNETRIGIYSWIYLFGLECSGACAGGREEGPHGEKGRAAVQRSPL